MVSYMLYQNLIIAECSYLCHSSKILFSCCLHRSLVANTTVLNAYVSKGVAPPYTNALASRRSKTKPSFNIIHINYML